MRSSPIRALPAHYREIRHLVLTDRKHLLLLNGLALVVFVVALWLAWNWWTLVVRTRGTLSDAELVWWQGLVIVLVIFPLHEIVHALAIALFGHAPRMGMKLSKGVLYATADGALFRRTEFIVIALAPLVVITAVGMLLILLLPASAGFWVGVAIAVNASGAAGDVWMVAAALSHPVSVLIRDEEDGIRVYAA